MTNPLIGLAACAVAIFVVVELVTIYVQPYLASVTAAFGAVTR